MNNKFMLFDKINGSSKEATFLLTFYYQNNDYVIYYFDNNLQNKDVFVSKIVPNPEGKKLISDISNEEKVILNTIAYNIVIASPMEAKKGADPEVVKNNLENKFSIKLSLNMPVFQNQDYILNCRLAITSNDLINNAISFYNSTIKVEDNNQSEQAFDNQNNNEIQIQNNPNDISNVQQVVNNNVNDFQNDSNYNQQMQILSSSQEEKKEIPVFNNHEDNNINEANNDGYVINASIIVGTIAILLAVMVVTFTFIAIKKMIIWI